MRHDLKHNIAMASIQSPPLSKPPVISDRGRISPTTWRFIITLVDGGLLIVSLLLLWVFVPPLHAQLRFSHYDLEVWDADTTILLLSLLVAVPILLLWRAVLASIMSLPRFRRRVIIVGSNPAGKIITEELYRIKRPKMTILGYISESVDEYPEQDGPPILGGSDTLSGFIQSGTIDMLIMAVDHLTNPELFQTAMEAPPLGIPVVPMTVAYERISGKIPVEYVGDHWYVALPSEQIPSLLYLCWHRLMDIAFALLGLVILFFVLPILALLIYLDSPGPIFYRQERVGYQGQKFYVHKFRSMHANAEAEGQAKWAVEGDTRVTRLGRFLRSTHLDELPQVFNILRGEMSLIGPRPERQAFVTALEKTIPFYRCRLSVKPGLTGWAQVKYPYASTGNDTLVKLQYDLYYIKHQSFTLDILIILMTIVEVVLCRGR